MLDDYLSRLNAEREQKQFEHRMFENVSTEELIKFAGVKVAEQTCPKCGSEMTKTGEMYKCSCGMMKKASAQNLPDPEILNKMDQVIAGMDKAAEDPSWWEKQKGVSRAMRAPGAEGSDKLLAHPELIGNRRIGSLKGGLKGMGYGGGIGAGAGTILGALLARKGAKLPSALVGAGAGGVGGGLLGGGIGSTMGLAEADRKWLAERGITPTWGGFSAEFSPEAAKKYLTKEKDASVSAVLKGLRTFGGSALKAGKQSVKRGPKSLMDARTVGGKAVKGMKQQATGAGQAVSTAVKGGDPIQAAKNLGQLGTYAVKRNPLAAAGVAGGAGAGYMMGKSSAAKDTASSGDTLDKKPSHGKSYLASTKSSKAYNDLKGGSHLDSKADDSMKPVEKTASKLLSKISAAPHINVGGVPVPMSELRESLEEAKGREDIKSRGRRGAVAGGVGGGLLGGGALGYLGHRIGGVPGAVAGGLLGAGGGGFLGARGGKQHGEEEAAADQALTILRALKAHNVGAQRGAGAVARAMGYTPRSKE